MPTLRIPRLPRLTWRRVCYCTLLGAVFAILTVVAVIVFAIFYLALPMRRAYHVEMAYQQELLAHNGLKPRIEHIPQLFTWVTPGHDFETWGDTLGLNNIALAEPTVAGLDQWIFLAGTAPDSRQQPDSFSHKWKRQDCYDDAYICDMYFEAFKCIAKRKPATTRYVQNWGKYDLSQTLLRWVDCDISPMLCDSILGLHGINLLVHMRTGCECSHNTEYDISGCPITWRWFGLPIYQAPWTRQIRIPLDRGGSTVVPAFPSAEEQLWSIIAHEGAFEGLSYDDEEAYPPVWNSMVNVTLQQTDPSETWPVPYELWSVFRDVVDDPRDSVRLLYATEVKCYVERYADILLAWWDDAADLVQPRSCVGIAEEKQKKLEEKRKKRYGGFDAEKHTKMNKKWRRLLDEASTEIMGFDGEDEICVEQAKGLMLAPGEKTNQELWAEMSAQLFPTKSDGSQTTK